jgi:hypothetical protein
MAEVEESPVERPSSNKPDVDVEPAVSPCERPSSESMWSLAPQLHTDAAVVSSGAASSYPSSAGLANQVVLILSYSVLSQ